MGNGFAADSSIWAAVNSWQKCSGIRLLEETQELVSIRYTFAAPAMPGLKTEITYTVDGSHMHVDVHYSGGAGRPQLPLLACGLPHRRLWKRWSGSVCPARHILTGRKAASLENTAKRRIFRTIWYPQECGCHMDTHQKSLHLSNRALTVEKVNAPCAFSAIPYTPQQLSEAGHAYELPAPCRTVVGIYGAMRGVGGINSWGADVEESYQIASDADISFSFRIRL